MVVKWDVYRWNQLFRTRLSHSVETTTMFTQICMNGVTPPIYRYIYMGFYIRDRLETLLRVHYYRSFETFFFFLSLQSDSVLLDSPYLHSAYI
jgi:hypothetical protein